LVCITWESPKIGKGSPMIGDYYIRVIPALGNDGVTPMGWVHHEPTKLTTYQVSGLENDHDYDVIVIAAYNDGSATEAPPVRVQPKLSGPSSCDFDGIFADEVVCVDELASKHSNKAWQDEFNKTCADYERFMKLDGEYCIRGANNVPEGMQSPADMCCVCGGGRNQVECHDLPGDASGDVWDDGVDTCAEYAKKPEWCETLGDLNNNGEGMAIDKCCVCGGGSRD